MNEALSDDWCAGHFDHLAPELNDHFHATLDRMRERYPVAHSDQYGGFWVVTKYDQVLEVLQDWRTFSSADKVSIPYPPSSIPIVPQEVDPPLHREFRRLINVFLTPAAVTPF